MLRNPIHKRIERFTHWQQFTFMAALCERMYPNFVFFCQRTAFADPLIYRQILDLCWESLTVKGAKINFDIQLEKLAVIIPSAEEFELYAVYPAMDACQALSELIHAHLDGDALEHAIEISKISLSTIAAVEMAKLQRELTDEELKQLPVIMDELDIQWEIYRLLNSDEEKNIDLIKGVKNEIKESNNSNIGLYLN